MSDDYLQARREWFENRFRRPMPWYETLDPEELGDLVWKASERLRLGQTGRLEHLHLAAYEHVR